MVFQILNQKLKKAKGISQKKAIWTENDTQTFERLLGEGKNVNEMERDLPLFTSSQIHSKIGGHRRKIKNE